jgi:2-keto-4-pentenoate hydratase/2-oxohepta-3-ene-1,7-dioic acid hydratase in catechol pathway
MRLCRFRHNGQIQAGLFDETRIVPLARGAKAYEDSTHESLTLPVTSDLMQFLPGDGTAHGPMKKLADWIARTQGKLPAAATLAMGDVELLVPVPEPKKLFLLAGNYAEHIREGGGIATEREETFPYVFMKPPSTTLTDPGKPVLIPSNSPAHIDWELELAVIMGRKAHRVTEADALSYVAGYTVVNDISNRKFRPNPNRRERPKDSFFDWLHGKWFDSFCPCGPCVTSADAIADPQSLDMKLRVNGEVKQDSSTGAMIFPVAAIIEFISSFVTLEPGDIISTGTPSGVGNTTGTYLQPGDQVEASIGSIGSLVSPVEAESA